MISPFIQNLVLEVRLAFNALRNAILILVEAAKRPQRGQYGNSP